jgi:hypothetical protein
VTADLIVPTFTRNVKVGQPPSHRVWWILLFIVSVKVGRTHSFVELRYFDEAKNERSKEMRPVIWAAVISAILGGVVTVLGERVVKWLFP